MSQTILNIPPNLYKQLRNTLLNCGPFANSAELKAIFVDARISNWRDSLPDATNAANRVNAIIDFLSRQSNVTGENALVLLLYAMSEQKGLGDTCHHQLVTLADQLQQHIKLSDTITNQIESSHLVLHNELPQQEKETQKMDNSKDSKLWKSQVWWVLIIIALIALSGTQLPKLINPDPDTFSYPVRVQSRETSNVIPNAIVIIEVAGLAPLDDITDSNGYARIFIDSDRAKKPAKLIVRATLYDPYVKNIDLKIDILPDVILLEPENVIETESPPSTLPAIIPNLQFEPQMVFIPAGEFIMGSNPDIDQWAKENEQPQHKVFLSDYYISETEITNSQYEAFIKLANYEAPERWTNGNAPNEMEDHPIVGVSWEDAIAYTKWLSEITGKNYRLPTEAEWEKACRGTEGNIFPWGNEWEPQLVTNFETIDSNSQMGTGTTSVYEHSPAGNSPFDVVDMLGNVWEWTSDWYYEQEYERHLDPSLNSYSYTDNSIVRNPYGYPAGSSKVLKGGSSLSDKGVARCACRGRNNTTIRYEGFGFRVALSP